MVVNQLSINMVGRGSLVLVLTTLQIAFGSVITGKIKARLQKNVLILFFYSAK